MIDVTDTLLISNSIFLAALTLLCTVFYRQLTEFLEAKIGTENATLAREISIVISEEARRAVLANEQVGRKGQEAKKYALEALQSALNQYGLKFDLKTIDDAIEAAVFGIIPPIEEN